MTKMADRKRIILFSILGLALTLAIYFYHATHILPQTAHGNIGLKGLAGFAASALLAFALAWMMQLATMDRWRSTFAPTGAKLGLALLLWTLTPMINLSGLPWIVGVYFYSLSLNFFDGRGTLFISFMFVFFELIPLIIFLIPAYIGASLAMTGQASKGQIILRSAVYLAAFYLAVSLAYGIFQFR